MVSGPRPWFLPFAVAFIVAVPIAFLDFVFGDPWRMIAHDAILAAIASGSTAWSLGR